MENRASIAFSIHGRNVRLDIPLPTFADFAKRKLRGRIVKTDAAWQQRAWEQSCRERWRAVLLVTKAKLELIEIGLSTVTREFLYNIALPSGAIVGEEIEHRLTEVYEGNVPLLPAAFGKGAIDGET